MPINIVLPVPVMTSMKEVTAFLRKIEAYRPGCANCGQAVTAAERAILATCGHAFHQECWELHVCACEYKRVACICPSCSACLRR